MLLFEIREPFARIHSMFRTAPRYHLLSFERFEYLAQLRLNS